MDVNPSASILEISYTLFNGMLFASAHLNEKYSFTQTHTLDFCMFGNCTKYCAFRGYHTYYGSVQYTQWTVLCVVLSDKILHHLYKNNEGSNSVFDSVEYIFE